MIVHGNHLTNFPIPSHRTTIGPKQGESERSRVDRCEIAHYRVFGVKTSVGVVSLPPSVVAVVKTRVLRGLARVGKRENVLRSENDGEGETMISGSERKRRPVSL